MKFPAPIYAPMRFSYDPPDEYVQSKISQIKLNSYRNAVIDISYHWQSIDEHTPRGVKLQLIDRAAGVAVYGIWTGKGDWSHWAPLPTFQKGEK